MQKYVIIITKCVLHKGVVFSDFVLRKTKAEEPYRINTI